jgi:hypothetical protein
MSPMYSPMEIARIVYMSSVGSRNVAFWTSCDADTSESSDAVEELLVVLWGRARFRGMTRVVVVVTAGRRNTRITIHGWEVVKVKERRGQWGSYPD